MALSPTIPTSFVPKQPVQPTQRRYSSGNNIFLYVSCAILGIAVVLALGVFFYSQYLNSVETAKAAELVAAQNKVSESDVDSFVRLHNRFVAAEGILSQHIALSQFFTLLGSITVQDVHFDSLQVQVADDRSAKITMVGDAGDFNSLAAESTAFAQQKNITSAIFSGITVNKDGTVQFTLNANLTPDLVVEQAAPSTPALLPAASAATTSSPTSFAPAATTNTSGASSASGSGHTPPAGAASSTTP